MTNGNQRLKIFYGTRENTFSTKYTLIQSHSSTYTTSRTIQQHRLYEHIFINVSVIWDKPADHHLLHLRLHS